MIWIADEPEDATGKSLCRVATNPAICHVYFPESEVHYTCFSPRGRAMNAIKTPDDLVAIRRHLHAHPELSNREDKTARFIEEKLNSFGIDRVERVCDTGVVALVEGDHAGSTRAYRADIDALPITEENDCDYASRNPGVMHACGHDVHTTVGLGVARRLQRRRRKLAGEVKFIFQPAEEASPEDEPVGAERMARQGVLDDPTVEAIYALHCMPSLEAGKIGHTGGPVWAGSELLEIEIEGTQAHGAYPHEGVDAVAVASQVVVALQQVVSRTIDARHSCVITVGRIEGGESYNILAENASMTGILRGLSSEAMDRARQAVDRIVDHVCQGLGARGQTTFTPGARPVINDQRLEAQAVATIADRLGDSVVTNHPPQLGAEDFSAFSQRIPGCYLFLGIRNEQQGITHALHTPRFDVDESCIGVGVEAMTEVLIR